MKWWRLAVGSLLLTLYAMPLASFAQSLTVEELLAIQARHGAAIMAMPGVIGVGIGLSITPGGQPVLRVLVDGDATMPPLPLILEGAPVESSGISTVVPRRIQCQSMKQLMNIQARHETAIMAMPGVLGIGIGASDGQSVFLVLVDQDTVMPPIPATLEGVPIVVIGISEIVAH